MNDLAESLEPATDIPSIKQLPHSIEAEQAVIGGLVIDNSTWDDVIDKCHKDDFFLESHRHIFEMMLLLAEQSKPFDVVTLSEELDKRELLDAMGGLTYLGEIASNTPSTANIAAYADIVRERALLRRLILAARGISDSAFNPDGATAMEVVLNAEQALSAISNEAGQGDGPKTINPLLTKAVERIDELFNSEGGITGITTGFKDLDERTSGLQPADLVIVAGRPSMGKTTFAMNLVENALLGSKRPVVVFSMEMPADSIVLRMLSSIGRIDQTRIRSGKLEEEDWPKLTAAISQLKDQPLFIDDTPALNPVDMRARLRKIYRQQDNDLGLIMVDYLQLMRGSGNKSEGRTQEISDISRSLKEMAKEFNCPLIALSQLNRSLEQRPNKRPVMSDLRESGAIEQDADLIAFIYRDEVYNEDSPDKGIAEIIIGKQRNGPIGTTKLAFIGKYTRFENLAVGSYDDSGYE